MDERVPRLKAPKFTKPDKAFDGLGSTQLMDIVLATSDLTLIVQPNGTIVDTAFSDGSIFEDIGKSWLGSKWQETVTDETRIKVENLLGDETKDGQLAWRQVNHFTQSGDDVPVNYAIVGKNGDGLLIVVGRNLQEIAQEQRRLMNAQLSMERSYVRLQSSEMRYRQIFQISNEAMLVVDGHSLKISEVNIAATRLFGGVGTKLEGRKIRDVLKASNVDVADVLMQAALTGDPVSDVMIVDREEHKFTISTAMLREDNTPLLIVRLSHTDTNAATTIGVDGASDLSVIQTMPDGFVMVNADERIVSANSAFCALLQVSNVERLLDEKFDGWFERSGVDCNVLMTNLKKYNKVRRFSTSLRGETGMVENVEISAVEVSNGKLPLYGFIVRPVGMTDRQTSANEGLLPHSAEQLTGLVGHMSLKEVVRETTSVIERLCIEAALELTDDNRASAAQLLGLSRQSLYDKLGRYNIDE
ncbi:MAG: transcriptional regulator PpsR [Hyphomicrobiales bacterium]